MDYNRGFYEERQETTEATLLMDIGRHLPDLGVPEQKPFRLSDDVRWDKGIVYDPEAPYNVRLNHKGVQFRLDNDQDIQLLIEMFLNGNVKAKTKIPMMGGNLNMEGSRVDGNNSYNANLQVPAFGGNLEIGARHENDQNRYNLQFRKEF